MSNPTSVLVLLAILLLAPPALTRPAVKDGRRRSSPAVETFARIYAMLHPNTEIYEELNEEYGELTDGDILVDEGIENELESNPLNAVVDPRLLWPNGVLYYTIQNGVYTADEVAKIEYGIQDLMDLTKVNGQYCIRILPYDNAQSNWVSVENYSGCSSYVGRRTILGGQRLSLVPSCVARHGTIMHEFLHAYGFQHEQKRYDRDDYISVNWDNIQPGYENNFVMLPEGQIDLLGTPYDYGSVMHYGAYGFAIDPTIPTIIPHDPKAEIGQRVTLSSIDIERVQILYGCLDPADSVHFQELDVSMLPHALWE